MRNGSDPFLDPYGSCLIRLIRLSRRRWALLRVRRGDLEAANVVWCSWSRPDYGWIELPVIGEDGWPRERRGVVDAQPGLYFLGIPFLYSFTSMLVLGAGRDASIWSIGWRLAPPTGRTESRR